MHIHTFMNACAHKYTRMHANTPFMHARTHACMHACIHIAHFISLHSSALHYMAFHSISVPSIAIPYVRSHYILLYCTGTLITCKTSQHTHIYIYYLILLFLLFKLFSIYVVQRWFPQLVSETAFVAWKGDGSEVEDFWLGQALGYLAAPRLGGLLVDCCLGDRRSQNNTA